MPVASKRSMFWPATHASGFIAAKPRVKTAPETRTARGKPAEGCLKMRAYHEGGQVNIEIIDDGGGINAERVLQKALQRGLITGEQAARMTEHEITQLIRALKENGPQRTEDLAALVGARYWDEGRFDRAVALAAADGYLLRTDDGRITVV